MEFLQLIDTIRSEQSTREQVASFYESERGIISPRVIRARPNYNNMLAEAMNLLVRARRSKHGMFLFEEAMNTQDFPLLMGDVLDRQLLGTYAETPQTWMNYCRRGTVPDFRTVKRFAVDGAEGVLPAVGEQGAYLPQVLSETKYQYNVAKYGRTLNWSWESWINDDLDALGSSSPARLGRAARRSEDKFATGLHVDTNGPHASVYATANKNIINTTNGAATSNPLLGIAGLQDGFQVIGLQLDADSEPIGIDGLILEVGPALEITARNVLNATEIKIGADSGAQQLITSNWMKSKVTLVVNPYIPVIATTNGRTTWFLHASPSVGRPAMEMGLLRGYEAPQLFQKMSNQQRIGGSTSPMDGSFEDDTSAFKVRHVFGGVVLDPKATYGSKGTGS